MQRNAATDYSYTHVPNATEECNQNSIPESPKIDREYLKGESLERKATTTASRKLESSTSTTSLLREEDRLPTSTEATKPELSAKDSTSF